MQLLVAILAVVIGLAFAFGGWRFFLLLLPLWGFVLGFSLGTEAMRSRCSPLSGLKSVAHGDLSPAAASCRFS